MNWNSEIICFLVGGIATITCGIYLALLFNYLKTAKAERSDLRNELIVAATAAIFGMGLFIIYNVQHVHSH